MSEISQEEKDLMLDDLKNQASLLNVEFHPSIGYEKLKEKVTAKKKELEAAKQAASDTAELEKQSKEAELVSKAKEVNAKVTAKQAANRLVRVRITCMNPAKKAYEGDIFQAGNSVIGTVKRYVPFEREWHMEQILLNVAQAKRYQTFHEVKGTGTGPSARPRKEARQVPEYAITILPDLTATEIKELKQRQLMASGAAE